MFRELPDLRRRGGWRQALRDEHADEASDPPRSRSPTHLRISKILGTRLEPCPLALDLAMDWAWGRIQAPLLQRYAASAVAGGCTHETLVKFSKFGGGGSSPQNIQAQLLAMFRSKLKAQSLIETLEGGVTVFAPPHKTFQALFGMNRARSTHFLGLNRMKLFLFWTDFFATPEGADYRLRHPFLAGKSARDLETSFPIEIHCDAGPFSKRLSAFVLSWSSIFSIGSELEIRYLIASWVKGSNDGGLWGPLWESFVALAQGRKPPGAAGAGEALAQDADGTIWCGIVLFLTADNEFIGVDCGAPSYNNNELCAWCFCNRTTMPWTDNGASALWRQNRCSHESFVSRFNKPHGLQLWPCFGRHFIRLDILHCVDYKGLAGLVFGGVVWSIVRDAPAFNAVVDGCKNRDERLAAVDTLYVTYARAHGISHKLPRIDMRSLFGDLSPASSFCELRGPGVKAANTRQSLPWVAHLAKIFDCGTQESHHRRLAAESLADWYKLVYAGGLVLSTDQYRAQLKSMLQCLRSFQWLAFESTANARMEWKLIPKLHYAAELALQGRLINPRFVQTYSGESLVGRLETMYAAAANGPYHATIQQTVLRKYLVGLEIRMSDALPL